MTLCRFIEETSRLSTIGCRPLCLSLLILDVHAPVAGEIWKTFLFNRLQQKEPSNRLDVAVPERFCLEGRYGFHDPDLPGILGSRHQDYVFDDRVLRSHDFVSVEKLNLEIDGVVKLYGGTLR